VNKLAEVNQALEDVRAAESELEKARERFRAKMRAAHKAGATISLLARIVGVSRQRVYQLIERD
jgi:hypothetical protein